MLLIAETTGSSLDEVRQMSIEDYENWLAYFGLKQDEEKEARDSVRKKLPTPKRNQNTKGKVDITHLLDEATQKGEKTIDLSGL